MNADSIFLKGKSHLICQDYCRHFSYNNNLIMVLSDGCSSSQDTDFGSRMLCITAIKIAVLKEGIQDPDFAFNIISRAAVGTSDPFLGSNFLDATLLIADVREGKLVCRAYGDGYLAFKRKSKSYIEVFSIKDMLNTPYYISYAFDRSRGETWKKLHSDPKSVQIQKTILEKDSYQVVDTFGITNKDYSFSLEEDATNLDWFCMSSDGLGSFVSINENKVPSLINETEIIREACGFKNFQGSFIQRRIGKFSRDCEKSQKHHDDDISLVGFNTL